MEIIRWLNQVRKYSEQNSVKIRKIILSVFVTSSIYADGWVTGKVFSVIAIPENHHGLTEWKGKVQFALVGVQAGTCLTNAVYGNNTLFWINKTDSASLSILLMGKAQGQDVMVYYVNSAPTIQGYCAASIVRID